ncbi:hypothetical protein IMCC9480_3282 [Oxalobacteraceae bacterium IMCC9480]|nr:hypothetical protein IMCC9480_3282 [Oxalobacteraceae bacterium IMCC9480]
MATISWPVTEHGQPNRVGTAKQKNSQEVDVRSSFNTVAKWAAVAEKIPPAEAHGAAVEAM